MVKDIFKKIISDWYLWLGLMLSLQFFQTAPRLGLLRGFPHWAVFLLQCIFEGGFFMWIMYRWKFPKSWVFIYIIAAAILDPLHIIPLPRLGFVLLFLGYYFLERRRVQEV